MNSKTEEIVKSLRGCSADEMDCKNCVAEWGRKYGYCFNSLRLYAADCLEAMEAELSRLKAQQRWIPVTERLPEDGFEVLVYTDRYGGRHEFAYYVPRLGAWYQNCALLIPNVTHWMPLPKPPKECDDRE